MSNHDLEKIIETVTFYFNGTFYGDSKLLYKAFHPDARITGIINEVIFDWSLSDFIARVTAHPTAQTRNEQYNKVIVSIDKTKNAAMVKSRVAVDDFIFFDYINLLKINGQWVIRHKSFTN